MALRILLLSLIALHLTACPGRGQQAPPSSPQQQQPQPQGGGVDSSGGDALKSSVEQVEEALAQVERNSFNALYRTVLVHSATNRYGIDRNYGIGIYDLLDRLISGNKRTVPHAFAQLLAKKIRFTVNREGSCLAGKDQIHKAGSAAGKNGEGEICLSLPELRKISPAAIEIEVTALALHEIAHLYGADEPSATRVQEFFVKNPKFTVISPAFVTQMEDMFREGESGIASLVVALRTKDDRAICLGLGQMRTGIMNFISIYNMNKGSLPNAHMFQSNFLRAMTAIDLTREFCTGKRANQVTIEVGQIHELVPVARGDWAAFMRNFEGIIYPVFTAHHLFTLLKDPYGGQPFAASHDLANAAIESFSNELATERLQKYEAEIAAFDPQTQIICREGELTIAQGTYNVRWNERPVLPQLLFKGPQGTVLNLPVMNANVMVRMLAGMKGMVVLTPMIEKLQVAATQGGLVTSVGGSGDKREVLMVGALGPGTNETVQFTIQNPSNKRYYTTTCKYANKTLSEADWKIEHPPMTVQMASLLTDRNEPYEEDMTYFRPSLAKAQIEGKKVDLKFVGLTANSVELHGEGTAPLCSLREEKLKEKGLNPRALADRLTGPDSAKIEIRCLEKGEFEIAN